MKKTPIRCALAILASAALLASARSSSSEQSYPEDPLRIFISDTDRPTIAVIEAISNRLAANLGRPMAIDARFVSTMLPAEIVATSPPTGYALLLASNYSHGSAPAIYPQSHYHAIRDFAPIIFIAAAPYVLSVHPLLPATTVRQLIALARSRPGQVSYGSSGVTRTDHLAGELLKRMADIDMVHVPYRFSIERAAAALVAGEAPVMFSPISVIQRPLKDKRVRALAVTSPKRSSVMPDLPTVAASGVPGFDVRMWFGLVAATGTPDSIVTRLNRETTNVLMRDDVRSRLAAEGLEVAAGTPEQFGDHIIREIAKFTTIRKAVFPQVWRTPG